MTQNPLYPSLNLCHELSQAVAQGCQRVSKANAIGSSNLQESKARERRERRRGSASKRTAFKRGD